MEDDNHITNIPIDILSENGKRTGAINKAKGSDYFSEIGKRSAASPLRDREYYSNLGKKSAALKKQRKLQAKKDASSVTKLGRFLSGKW